MATFTGGFTKGMKNPICFVAGTMVLTVAGLRAIETIKAGDKVIATNPDTNQTEEKTVVETYVNQTEVEFEEKQETVYNFQVEDYHTYYVGESSVLVHNACDRVNSLTKEQLDQKPKNSPDPNKWFKKNGTISIDDDGVWTYHDAKGNSVRYPNGYPDFKNAGLVKQEVDIGEYKDYATDFNKADSLAPNGPRDAINNTWHHAQDGYILQEVDKVIHKVFTHRGGMSLKNKK